MAGAVPEPLGRVSRPVCSGVVNSPSCHWIAVRINQVVMESLQDPGPGPGLLVLLTWSQHLHCSCSQPPNSPPPVLSPGPRISPTQAGCWWSVEHNCTLSRWAWAPGGPEAVSAGLSLPPQLLALTLAIGGRVWLRGACSGAPGPGLKPVQEKWHCGQRPRFSRVVLSRSQFKGPDVTWRSLSLPEAPRELTLTELWIL